MGVSGTSAQEANAVIENVSALNAMTESVSALTAIAVVISGVLVAIEGETGAATGAVVL